MKNKIPQIYARAVIVLLALCLLDCNTVPTKAGCAPRDDKGFVRTFPNTGDVFGNAITTPLIADVDGDGKKEIFFLRDHFLHGLDAEGNDLPNFPIDLLKLAGGTRHVPLDSYTISLADFSHDGNQQIVAHIRLSVPEVSVLFVLSNDGTVFGSWPEGGVRLAPILASSPTIADLDNDGTPEIILGGGLLPAQGILYVLKADGTPYNDHFPLLFPGVNIASTIAAGDLNGDGLKEMVFVDGDSKVHAIKSQDGSEVPGWPVGIRAYGTSVALGDVNNDGRLDVVVTADQEYSCQVFVLNADGTRMAGWPVTLPECSAAHLNSPSLANLDDDPDLEIIFSSANKVYVYKADGTPFPGWPQPVASSSIWASNVTVGDMDGDGRKDITYLSREGHWYTWKSDGTLFPGMPRHFTEPSRATNNRSTPVITDLQGDGHREVVFTMFFNAGFGDPPEMHFAKIFATDMNACVPETDDEWRTFHRDNQRTGLVP